MPHRLSPARPAHGRHGSRSLRLPAARSSRAKRALALFCAALPFFLMGCASLAELLAQGENDRPLLNSAARQSRMQTLQISIEEDHDILEALVTGERDDSDGPLHTNQDLRAIAERLSQNEDELEALLRTERVERAKAVSVESGAHGENRVR